MRLRHTASKKSIGYRSGHMEFNWARCIYGVTYQILWNWFSGYFNIMHYQNLEQLVFTKKNQEKSCLSIW